ncbi:carbohydrate ABC transporter permease [Caldicellulosiruptoraceae bacterium PP1]
MKNVNLEKTIAYTRKHYVNILSKTIIYALLIGIGYAYLYPLFFMISSSLMSIDDLVSPIVSWIPRSIYLDNYEIAWKVLDANKALFQSIFMAGLPAILQTVATALVGYGLARFEFPLKKLWLFLVVATFLIPAQVTVIPKYMLFDRLKIVGTPLASFLPAIAGQGIKSSIFVLMFYNFFKMMPKAFDEAAEIDGAGSLQIFFRIALPTAVPAIVVAFIFSFVWYWNETYISGLFFGDKIRTLPLKLRDFVSQYQSMYPTEDGSTENRINEGIRMAGTFITILPLLIMYLVLQKQFVESIEKSGITGE